MAELKKNQMNQVILVAVDATDFATIESTVTASDFNSGMTGKFYGVNHGVSTAFTSGTISKAATLVHSGIFQQTLKAAECNYDFVLFRWAGHPSLADILMPFQMVNDDDSDIMSRLSDFFSDFQSRVPKAVASQSLLSDVRSDLKSYLAVMSGVQSDAYSMLSDFYSDFQSRVPKAVASQSLLSDVRSDLRSQISGITASVSASDISDIASAVWAEKWRVHSLASSFGSFVSTIGTNAAAGASRALLNQSLASDAHSAAAQANSRVLVVQSMVSDVDSQLLLNASVISDIDSQLLLTASKVTTIEGSQFDYLSAAVSDAHSDLRSLTSGITATVSASDMSDIASRVWATAEGTRVDSRILLIQSIVSDIESDMRSDLKSAIAGITATVTASDISDIASAVWANTIGARVDSRLLLTQSMVSDIDSQLIVTHSLLSDVQSELSDTHSDLASKIAAIPTSVSASDMSDIASAVWAEKWRVHSLASSFGSFVSTIGTNAAAGASRALLVQSRVSDVESQLDVTHSLVSDIDSQLTVTHSLLSDVHSEISDTHSDLASKLAAIPTAISASDISDIASRVWAEKWRVHSLASSFGSFVSGIGSHAAAGASRALVAQSMISDVESQLDVTHSLVSDIDSQVNLNASLASDAHSAAAQANSRALVIESLVSDVDSQLTVTHSLVSDVESAVDKLDSVLASRINAQVLDVMNTDTFAEPSGVPAATATLQAKISWLAALSRNKITQTATVQSLRNDGDTANIASAAVSDDATTATRDEFA